MQESNDFRFQAELEFVTALGSIDYLQHLVNNKYLDDHRFVNYLNYLQYWKLQPYSKFIMYPHALVVLDLLQNDQFRSSCKNPNFLNYLRSTQFQSWRFHQKHHALATEEVDTEMETQGEVVME
ncbi:hypothetical protein P9112_009042 [Eukaryota sp. TZLM1-RC]